MHRLTNDALQVDKMLRTAKLVRAIILVAIALALAIWSGFKSFVPQGREVGKLPGTFPSIEAEMEEKVPPAPVPNP